MKPMNAWGVSNSDDDDDEESPQPEEIQQGVAVQQGTEVQVEEDVPYSQQIRNLLFGGYSGKEIVEQFGFARSTVVQEALKIKNSKATDNNKNGKTEKETVTAMVARMSQKDLVPPEYALERIGLSGGEYKTGFIDGINLLLLAARYNQVMAAGNAEVLKGQLDIFKASQGGTEQAIQVLTSEFAQSVMDSNRTILEAVKQNSVSASPDPMKAMMVQTMQPIMGQVLGQMMSAFPKVGGQAQLPPQDQQQQPQPQTQSVLPQPQTGINIEHHSLDELEDEE